MEKDLGGGPIAGAGRLKPDWNFSLAYLTYFMPECFSPNAPERRARFSNASRPSCG